MAVDIENESFGHLEELHRRYGNGAGREAVQEQARQEPPDRIYALREHFSNISFRDMMMFAKALSVGLSDRVSDIELACALRDWAESG